MARPVTGGLAATAPEGPSGSGGPPPAPVRPKGVRLGRLDDLLGYHLRRAQVVLYQSFAETLGADNISPGQLGVLLLVRETPGLNQTRLGAALGIDRSTLVAVLDRLQGRGLVARKPSATDRRSHALELTATGRAFLDDVMPRVHAHEAAVGARLSAEERRTLIALLDKVGGG